MSFLTADLYDDHGEALQVSLPIFTNYGGTSRFYGKIVTVKCHEDNSLVAEQVKTEGRGRVLVVDGGASQRRALLGDNLARQAMNNGWAGIVIYGCMRDSVEIGEMAIGVKAMGTTPAKTVKRKVGLLNEVVQFAGVVFRPGHFLYSDEDGLVVSEKNLLE